MDMLKSIFSKAVNACKDDSVLVIAICALAAIIVLYLIQKGVIVL